MRIVIIGGSGHIGSFLTPMVVSAGMDVTCVSRGLSQPYQQGASWNQVRMSCLDRSAEESAGNFGECIARLDADVVVDLTCYTLKSGIEIVESLRNRVDHFLHCGTIWVHGHSVEVPTNEDAPRDPFGDYGIGKSEIEAYLLQEATVRGFPRP